MKPEPDTDMVDLMDLPLIVPLGVEVRLGELDEMIPRMAWITLAACGYTMIREVQ
jgi:hypothetical protein